MKKTRNLVLLIALALVLVAGAVGGGYAYWAGSVEPPGSEKATASIVIGKANKVTTTLTVGAGQQDGKKKLVPQGQADNSVGGSEDNADEILVDFVVTWNGVNAVGHPGILSVNPTVTQVGASKDEGILKLITFELVSPTDDMSIVVGTEVTVKIKITMKAPSVEQYGSVAGQPITLSVEFGVTPQ